MNTLRSIKHFRGGYDIETIIVDDGSEEKHQIYDVKKKFPELNINLIVLERDSSWRGACIAYNTGFKSAKGDIIIINSAECFHVGYVLSYVASNLTPEKYFSFATYEGDKRLTWQFNRLKWDNPEVFDDLKKTLGSMPNNWQVKIRHDKFKETYIPFCGAIHRENMIKLSGYDERFVHGIGYDDYDFTDRILNLGLKRQVIDKPFVVHQWHPPTVYSNKLNIELLEFLRKHYPERIKATENKIYRS